MEAIGMAAALILARAVSAGWTEFDRFLFTVICLGFTALLLASMRF